MIFLKPTTDIAFKKLFASQEHTNVLMDFLNSVLQKKEGEKITAVTINDPHNLPEIEELKFSIVDVFCEDQQGKKYIVEMQVTDRKDFIKRAQFYTSIAYSRQLKSKWKYNELLPVIFVGILNFNIFKNPSYLTHHLTVDIETMENACNNQEFHFVELKKFNKTLDELVSGADLWIYLLKNAHELNEVPKQYAESPALEEAFSILEEGKWTLEDLEKYQIYFDASIAEEMIKETAEERGEARGFERGVEKGIESVAFAMIKRKIYDTSMIAELTGLSVAEIEELKKDM